MHRLLGLFNSLITIIIISFLPYLHSPCNSLPQHCIHKFIRFSILMHLLLFTTISKSQIRQVLKMGKTYRRVSQEDSRTMTGLETHVFRVVPLTPGTKWGKMPSRDGGTRGGLFCHDGGQGRGDFLVLRNSSKTTLRSPKEENIRRQLAEW